MIALHLQQKLQNKPPPFVKQGRQILASLRGTTLGVTRQSPTTLHKTQGKQDTFCTVEGDCPADISRWTGHGLRPRNDGGF